jgi:hypothetical protein
METLEDGWRETTCSLDKHGTASIFIPEMTTSIQHVRCSDIIYGSYSGVSQVRCDYEQHRDNLLPPSSGQTKGAAKRVLNWREQDPPKRHGVTA